LSIADSGAVISFLLFFAGVISVICGFKILLKGRMLDDEQEQYCQPQIAEVSDSLPRRPRRGLNPHISGFRSAKDSTTGAAV
jgi:hypothetical protein